MLSRTEIDRRRRVMALRIRQTVAARRLALLRERPEPADAEPSTRQPAA